MQCIRIRSYLLTTPLLGWVSFPRKTWVSFNYKSIKTLEGINYCINQEEALKVFLNDGDVPLDNNATEGALRSFCLHKHAWKLIDSIDGAKSSAIIYSITETAKANNLNPFRYLDHVLTVLKDHQDDTDYSFIEKLLPWSDQLPEICRSKSKTTNL